MEPSKESDMPSPEMELSVDSSRPSLDEDSQSRSFVSSNDESASIKSMSRSPDDQTTTEASAPPSMSSSSLSLTESSPPTSIPDSLTSHRIALPFHEAPRAFSTEAVASSPLSAATISDINTSPASHRVHAATSGLKVSTCQEELSEESVETSSLSTSPSSCSKQSVSSSSTDNQDAARHPSTTLEKELLPSPMDESRSIENPHVDHTLTSSDCVYQRGSDRKRKQPQRFGYNTIKPVSSVPPTKRPKRRKTEVIPATPTPEIPNKPSLVVKLDVKPQILLSLKREDNDNDRTDSGDLLSHSRSKTRKRTTRPRARAQLLSSLMIPVVEEADCIPVAKNEPEDVCMSDIPIYVPSQEDPSNELSSYCESTIEAMDPYLLHVSRMIMAKTSIDDKPLPRGRPQVWANSRQALCETVLYYQAWQGACYISKGVLYSFMFDSNGHSRDLIDNDVVIARAGGGMTKDTTGEMMQSKDQKDNSQSQAVKAAIAQQNPIVIFCGKHNSDVPTKLPYRYNSLSWYKPTHVWSEKVLNKRGQAYESIKYRFEKLDTSDQSWWCPSDTDLVKIGDLDPAVEETCKECTTTHQQVYLEGWMCLNAECAKFWTLPDGSAPKEELNYDPRFLKTKTAWSYEVAPHDMRPALPNPAAKMGEDVTYAMTRGMCCPECGKCTSRYLWKGWICSGCGFQHAPEHIIIPALSIRDPWHPVSSGYSVSHDWADRQYVKTTVNFSHNYHIVHYEIEGIQGRITHLVANKTVNEEPGGPDEIFEALQTLDVGLERRKFVTGKEEFMTAFSTNHGMPYKFVASVDSQPFEGAPWPLTETRSRLNWAARTIVDDLRENEEFNELLTIGYFDGQNIKYHDDGEHGLGDTVASLSLGHPADMSFRVKSKHFTGVSKSGTFTDKMPIPGTCQYEERRVAYEDLHTISKLDYSGRKERLRSMARELNLKDVCKDRKAWIRLRLSHGDIVVMHGPAIQEYLEHQVDPMGRLRFAMTCRTILAHHLKPEELPAYEVGSDDGGYDGSRITELRTATS